MVAEVRTALGFALSVHYYVVWKYDFTCSTVLESLSSTFTTSIVDVLA